MNAQTVVDTFAPFVGTEGLRGVVSVHKDDAADIVRVCLDTWTVGTMMIPEVAHGFLLSRLAEGLAKEGWTIRYDEYGGGYWIPRGTIHGEPPDYPSAILAAARVEWTGKKTIEERLSAGDIVAFAHFTGGTTFVNADGTVTVRDAEIKEISMKRD